MRALLVLLLLSGCREDDVAPEQPGVGEPATATAIGGLCQSACLDAAACSRWGTTDGGVCRKRCGADVFRFRWEYIDAWHRCLGNFAIGDCDAIACRGAADNDLVRLSLHTDFDEACADTAIDCPTACADLDIEIYSSDATEDLVSCFDMPCADRPSCLASRSSAY
jgi:hypothetical protein